MSKIVVLTASPRANGNSRALAAAFAEAATALGHQVTTFHCADLHVSPCTACMSCGDGGKCIFSDDYDAIRAAIAEADGIVMASPVYWYSFPAGIKAVMDRWYHLCMTGENFIGKRAALLGTCEDTVMSAFDGLRFSFEKSMGYLQAEIVGEILVPAVHTIGDVEKTDGPAKAKFLAEKF